MTQTRVTKDQLVADFKKLGIKAGDLLMVHSSLSSLGEVEGGALTVVKALLEVLGPQGTLMMPTFAALGPFDIKNTPSKLGAITEALRLYPGAVRSFHPTHSVAVLGPRSQELIKDHVKSPTAAGRETPYGRLIALGGKILLLGVDNDRNTTMHTLEEYVAAPYLSDYEATYLDEAGRVHLHRLKLYPGPHRDFIGVVPLLEEKGALTTGKVADALCRLIDAARMHDVVTAAFKTDPALVLCDNPTCADCVMQRRKIRQARLAKEDFTLSALASSISPYPDEILAELGRAGITDLVIDRLYGLPVWRLDEKRIARAARAFNEENIHVSAVAAASDGAILEKGLLIANSFQAPALIVPLAADAPSVVEWAAGHAVTVFFENGELTARTALELLKAARAGEVLAFNPAAFARMGERSFLGVYSRSGLKRFIGMLLLSDAIFGGEFTLPGRGNGEVKELLSILRCSSFDGRVVLAAGPGGPAFRDLVESFWTLMETM